MLTEQLEKIGNSIKLFKEKTKSILNKASSDLDDLKNYRSALSGLKSETEMKEKSE